MFNTNSVDDRILSLAFHLQKSQPKSQTILVSKDINLRIKADALGLLAEDYENDRILIKDLYTGMIELTVPAATLAAFRASGELELNGGQQYFPNEYCTLIEDGNPKPTALTKVDLTGTKLVPILDSREGIWGIKPRNREQHFAFDALLDDRVKLVTLMGKAGTGKTLLALAAGLKRTVLDREFRRLVVARPTVSMGKELGFLPGSLEEKLAPWMQPIHDALKMLGDLNMGHEHRRSGDLLRSGSIVVEALSYIRGRSIANQFMIIDEAQNLTPLETKTIITRVGHGTKIVLTGDPYQIDNPYVDSSSMGSIMWSAASARSQSRRTLNCRKANDPSWPSWPRTSCEAAIFHSRLGFRRSLSYRKPVIGFLRFVGILNAAVWLGAAVFFTFGAGFVPFSQEMRNLLGANNFPYFSGAIAQILIARYYYFQAGCALVAVVHLLAEWLYLGKYPQKLQAGLLIGLAAAVLLGGSWFQPRLRALHAAQYGINTGAEFREAAAR